jgi:hypothetical protein
MSLFNLLKRTFGRDDTQDESPSEPQTKRQKTAHDDPNSSKRQLDQFEGTHMKDKNGDRRTSLSEHQAKRLKVVVDDRMEVDEDKDADRMAMDEHSDEENEETNELDSVQPVGGSMIAFGPRRVPIKDNVPWGWSLEELETGERQTPLIRVLGSHRA